MTFYIKKDSELPSLRMQLIDDGRHSFRSFHESIQNAVVTFTMTNKDTSVAKIMNAPCEVQKREIDSCEEQYVVCYNWKKRDTKDVGVFKGVFNIDFGKITSEDGTEYPTGRLVMPIREELDVIILP